MFAHELAKVYDHSTDNYLSRLDRMLMYLGRYAMQDATALERVPTVTLLSWVDRTAELLEEEAAQIKAGRGHG